MISAKIVLDSVSLEGHRLTTFDLRYPKFIHGELMTHRKFSRNASSSRAIPTSKLLQEVRDVNLRAAPHYWGKNKPGMQATEEFKGAELEQVLELWDMAAQNAADVAEKLTQMGLHKQTVNRLLEPFSHINVVVSATEFMNFFGLRLDMAAQPEMRELALKMWTEYVNNEPKLLKPTEWHLPYVDHEDRHRRGLDQWVKISVARCARVSYRSFETGKRSTCEEDEALYGRLMSQQPLHASPAEHQAQPDFFMPKKDGGPMEWHHPEQHGNFTGWRQWRKQQAGEDMAPLPPEFKDQWEQMINER